jgi:hypothetical protein
VDAEEEEDAAVGDLADLLRGTGISSHTPRYHGGRRRTRRNRKA